MNGYSASTLDARPLAAQPLGLSEVLQHIPAHPRDGWMQYVDGIVIWCGDVETTIGGGEVSRKWPLAGEFVVDSQTSISIRRLGQGWQVWQIREGAGTQEVRIRTESVLSSAPGEPSMKYRVFLARDAAALGAWRPCASRFLGWG